MTSWEECDFKTRYKAFWISDIDLKGLFWLVGIISTVELSKLSSHG